MDMQERRADKPAPAKATKQEPFGESPAESGNGADGPEMFDLYDADGRPLGTAKAREEVHRDGDWHRSAHVWVYTGDGRLLLQRRAATKDTWPGCLDASVGGHYRAGEAPFDAVAREVREELGIEIQRGELVSLGVRRVEGREPGIIDRELNDVYLLRRDLPLAAYRPDPEEIDGLVLLDAGDAVRLHDGTLNRLEAKLQLPGDETPVWHTFTARDLIPIPSRGPYLAAVARAISDLLAGRPITATLPRDDNTGPNEILRLVAPNFRWAIPGVLAGVSRPRSVDAMNALYRLGIRALVSLTETPLPDILLQPARFRGVHLPIPDFTAPTMAHIDRAVSAIDRFCDERLPVAVHCGAGLGRTGTILACYLVAHGTPAGEAIARVREQQPGSIETPEQEDAVTAYELHRATQGR